MTLTSSQQQIEQAYAKWTDTVTSAHGDPTAVVSLYAEQAILLPTMSPEVCRDKDAISRYFTTLTAPPGLRISTEAMHIQVFDTIAIASGIYTFHYQKNHVNDTSIAARFSFVFQQQQDGQWLIIQHHSSVLPTPPA